MPLPWEVESGNEIDVAASVRPVNTHAQCSDLDSALDDLAASRTIEHRFMSLYFSSYHTPTGRYISPIVAIFNSPTETWNPLAKSRDRTVETPRPASRSNGSRKGLPCRGEGAYRVP